MKEYLSKSLNSLPAKMEEIKLMGISIKSFIQYPYALALAKELNIRFPCIAICLGGCYITLSQHDFPGYISYIIKGNGGEPLCHLADHILNKSPYNPDFPGLYKINGTNAPGNGKYQCPPDWERLPDYSDLNLEDYQGHPYYQILFNQRPTKPYLLFDYRTSMGCSNRCSFCKGREVDHLKFKSVRKVIHDLKGLQSLSPRYGEKDLCIAFVDNSINNSPKHLNDLLDGVLENNINMRWLAYAKVHQMTPDLLEKCARCGCKGIFWGIEAVTPRMLKIYNKQFNPEEAESCILKAAELKIVSFLSLIYNGPDETDEDFEALLNFLVKFSKYQPFVIPNLCEFLLEENSDIYNNPGNFNIELVRYNHDPYSSIRPSFEWKEIGIDLETLKKRHIIRKEKINRLIRLLWKSYS